MNEHITQTEQFPIDDERRDEINNALGERAMSRVLLRADGLRVGHAIDSSILSDSQKFVSHAVDHLARMEDSQATQEEYIEDGAFSLDKSKVVVRKIAQQGVDEGRVYVEKAGKRLDKARRKYDRGVRKAARHYKRNAAQYQLAARLQAEKDGVMLVGE